MRTICLVATLLLTAQVSCLAKETDKSKDYKATSAGKDSEKGFVSIFDGKTLKGWQSDAGSYAVENGTLICKKGSIGRLNSKKQYANFVLRFDFKLQPGANNGVALRARLGGGEPAFEGLECQILDDSSPKYKTLKPYQFHGSIYGIFPAKRGSLKPVGKWNSQEIVCNGTKIKVTVNGKVVVDNDLEAVRGGTMDERTRPNLYCKTGYVGFIGHGDRVEFRNIRIKELKSESK